MTGNQVMIMNLFIRLSVFSFLMILFACGGPEPDAEVEAITTAPAPEKTTMPADQIAATRNAAPETIAEEKMETPEVRTETVEEELKKEVAKKTAIVPKAQMAAPETKPASPASKTASAPAAAPSVVPEETPVAQPAPKPDAATPPTIPVPSAPSHSAWQSLLKTYVNAKGEVNYAGLRKQEKELDAYLATLAGAIPESSWTKNERLAYWLNAYNAYTFKLILNNYPVGSITDLNGGDPWKVKWIELDGKTYSLNQIEHDIIRPRFKDARIHFAVVCAARSCPPLANEAFTARNVNALLETRTRQFVNNSSYNQTGGDSPKISKIFDWYGEDFGDVKAYLNKYLTSPIADDVEIGYMDYDWALNKQ